MSAPKSFRIASCDLRAFQLHGSRPVSAADPSLSPFSVQLGDPELPSRRVVLTGTL